MQGTQIVIGRVWQDITQVQMRVGVRCSLAANTETWPRIQANLQMVVHLLALDLELQGGGFNGEEGNEVPFCSICRPLKPMHQYQA